MIKTEEKVDIPIGITMGCPVGIGPEIILRFYSESKIEGSLQAVVLGDLNRLRYTAGILGLDVEIVGWRPGDSITNGKVYVLELSQLNNKALMWGQPDQHTGKAMAKYIEHGVQLISQNKLKGLVTCPIAKAALHLAGYNYPGHTEMLADLTGSAQYQMMMAGKRLKVVLVTIHEPLKRVPEIITKKKIIECVETTAFSLSNDFGISNPNIAVAGLNPHSGEGGIFGLEEEQIIGPAVRECRKKWLVSGPWPPDTVFHKAVSGMFDAVVAMYHDQGLIPFKLLHFNDGVNVTIGLPIVRTSVDHGTAYDIAGQGTADYASLAAAYELASSILKNRSLRNC